MTGARSDFVHRTSAHILYSHEAAVDLLRAFGGDPRFLDTIHDADPQPNTP